MENAGRKKQVQFLMQENFTKEKKVIFITFANYIFPLSKQYLSVMDDWEEDKIDSSQFLSK